MCTNSGLRGVRGKLANCVKRRKEKAAERRCSANTAGGKDINGDSRGGENKFEEKKRQKKKRRSEGGTPTGYQNMTARPHGDFRKGGNWEHPEGDETLKEERGSSDRTK